MSEASNKQAIELCMPTAGKATSLEYVLDLLKKAASENDGNADRDGLRVLNSAASAGRWEEHESPSNDDQRQIGVAHSYSCASPAVVTILRTLSEMFS